MKGLSQLPPQLGPAALSARQERDARLSAHDFDAAPFTIAWEVTRACAYSCAHCRADAQPRRDRRELDTEEGMRVIDMLADFGTGPILVLTGGDPLMRRDLFELARYADCHLPGSGWGMLRLSATSPRTAAAWTGSGN